MSEKNMWVVKLLNVNDETVLSESESLAPYEVSSRIKTMLEEHEKADPNNLKIEVLPDE